MPAPRVSAEVARALRDGRPVVALESTIFSTLGLPRPANREALRRCCEAVTGRGAVPALTAVLDGEWRVGVAPDEQERLLDGCRKVAERDLAVSAALHWDVGVTTASAALALAHRTGIEVFATGGIGGVHRGDTGDVSADLDALAAHPVLTACAGAKAFLDLPRTLEHLETRGVPVLGWRHDEFPAFYTRSSGLPVAHRVDTAAQAAAVLRHRARPDTGVLLAVPVPPEAELEPATVDEALRACAARNITGAAVTPFVLDGIARATAGRSVGTNVALAEHNAAVAAEVASALRRS